VILFFTAMVLRGCDGNIGQYDTFRLAAIMAAKPARRMPVPTLMQKLRDAIRSRLWLEAEEQALARLQASHVIDAGRQRHLLRIRDETLARVTFGQG
jgi:hypothetical protein